MAEKDEAVISETRRWIETVVIGLNLCPFAREVQASGRIRYRVSDATTAEGLRSHLAEEALLLRDADPARVETTVLIHPQVLGNFLEYNDFLDIADETLEQLGLTGEIQVASFHPGYVFEGVAADDVTNGTNRSPYPMLHLLREASVERAVAEYPDVGKISERNMETMRRLK